MKHRRLSASFNDALQGIIYVVRTEKNMRIHVAIGLLVVMLATILGVTRV